MTELNRVNPERRRLNPVLDVVDIDGLTNLIEESEGPILPSASTPDQTSAQLFEIFI